MGNQTKHIIVKWLNANGKVILADYIQGNIKLVENAFP